MPVNANQYNALNSLWNWKSLFLDHKNTHIQIKTNKNNPVWRNTAPAAQFSTATRRTGASQTWTWTWLTDDDFYAR